MELEVTTPVTPQQNSHIEWKYATLFNQVCAILNSGKFKAFLRHGLQAETANTTMLLENNVITPNRSMSPFQQFFGKEEKHPVYGAKIR